MMRRGVLARTLAAAFVVSSASIAQPCPVPCNGIQVVCDHQNGIRNHRAVPSIPWLGPNTLTIGNWPGDAEWKIWAVENGMTRGNGISTVTNWEIGAVNLGPSPATFNIPDMELRPVVAPGGVKEPDMAAAPLYATTVGTIALPTGSFRINLSIQVPPVAAPTSCAPVTTLPTLSNADVAMLFLHTPLPFVPLPTSPYVYRNLVTASEASTVSNPSNPATGTGNSYSGTYDALLGVVTHYPITQELLAELGFLEPTLEAYRQTTGFAAPARGSGARELAAGDTLVLVVEDWQAGTDAINGQDRLSAVLISDGSAGSPVGQTPPGAGIGFLPGSALLPGSSGLLPIYPTPLTTPLLVPFSATFGQGFNCHVLADVTTCTTTTGSGPNAPSVFSDMQATTASILVPPGLTGLTLYAAAFSVNLTALTIPEATNLVELEFL